MIYIRTQNFIKTFLLKFIIAYQKTLSPDHGLFKAKYQYGFCKYYPSCSEYAKQAIIKEGVVMGSLKSLKRIIWCNPFSKGGIDNP